MIRIGTEKRTYSFRFDEDLIRQLQRCAARENRTLSNMVETILKRHVELLEARGGAPDQEK